MRNDDVSQAKFGLQVLQQIDDLCLYRNVECRDRLVRDDHLWVERERTGYADALTLTAGKLMGISVVMLRIESDKLEQVLYGALDAVRGLDVLNPEWSPDDRADRVPRVQRRERILEDHLHVLTERPQLPLRHVRDVVPVELDAATGGLDQPGKEPPCRRLATTRLADEAHGLAADHVERHAVDGLDRTHLPLKQTRGNWEVLLEPVYRQQDILRPGTVCRAHAVPSNSGLISSCQICCRVSTGRWQRTR
jgi:hypothetical protein